MSAPALAVRLYADPEELERRLSAWFDRGAHPPRVKYAEGAGLDPAAPAMQLVQRWIAQGLARSVEERGPDGVLRKFVERVATAPVAPPTSAQHGADLRLLPLDRHMLATLRAFAGEALPENRALAGPSRHRNAQAVHYRLRRLSLTLGLIELRWARDERGREVRFCRVIDIEQAPPTATKPAGMEPEGRTLAQACPSAAGGRQKLKGNPS